MTENQTNPQQPSEPREGDGQNAHGTAKKRRGHFASDGLFRRRAPSVPTGTPPQTGAPVPPVPPAVPQPQAAPAPPQFGPRPGTRAAAQAATTTDSPSAQPKRFDTAGHKPIVSKHPIQSVKTAPVVPVRRPVDAPFESFRLLLLAVFFVPLCIWASLPSWQSMVYEWYYTDDYSHGFIVIPATILFLYLRRDTYPGTRYKLDWVGLFPIFLYGALRYFAGHWYVDALDMLAIWFWILGIVWFFYGWRVFLWALPSLCFLVFMFQLPWRIDVLLKHELQQFAAQFAAVLLNTVGIAAFPINNIIRMSTMELGVEAACSGLRFLMSVFAIAFAAVLLLRRPWWQNVLILAIAAPLALFVNAVRIAITGIFLERFPEVIESIPSWIASGHTVGATADEFAGKIAIALALGLFALFIWFLGKVFRQVEV